MAVTGGPIAVCDANVLIDYLGVDEDLVRELVRYWEVVYVPDVVLNEVRSTSRKRAEELGLQVLSTPLELPESRRLSYPDRACLHFVTQNRWTCIVNDVRLRKECQIQGVTVIWGLEMLVLMVESGQLTVERARGCALKIYEINPSITKAILDEFQARLLQC